MESRNWDDGKVDGIEELENGKVLEKQIYLIIVILFMLGRIWVPMSSEVDEEERLVILEL